MHVLSPTLCVPGVPAWLVQLDRVFVRDKRTKILFSATLTPRAFWHDGLGQCHWEWLVPISFFCFFVIMFYVFCINNLRWWFGERGVALFHSNGSKGQKMRKNAKWSNQKTGRQIGPLPCLWTGTHHSTASFKVSRWKPPIFMLHFLGTHVCRNKIK